MNPLTYTIVRGNRDYPEQFHKVNGLLLFELFGYQWAAHKEMSPENESFFENWIVSEVSTGFELQSGKIFFCDEEAKEWAWVYLLKKGEGLTRFHVEKARMKIQEYENFTNFSSSSLQG
jgi:hypothetical protein